MASFEGTSIADRSEGTFKCKFAAPRECAAPYFVAVAIILKNRSVIYLHFLFTYSMD